MTILMFKQNKKTNKNAGRQLKKKRGQRNSEDKGG